MSTTPVTRALFEGLVYDESGNPVEVAMVGGIPCYVVDDDGFRVHVTSEPIDRQIIESFREQFLQHREIATEAMLKMLGSDDLFTRRRSMRRWRTWTGCCSPACPRMRA